MQGAKDFKVAIVGGGIAGLTLAISLSRGGVPVDLYESAVRLLALSMRVEMSLRHLDFVPLPR